LNIIQMNMLVKLFVRPMNSLLVMMFIL